jgi:hypothetical protein
MFMDKSMKPKIGDIFVYVFIVILVGLSFLGLKTMSVDKGNIRVQIELDGQVIDSLEVWQDGEIEAQEIRVDTGEGGYNIVKISSEGVVVLDANCPDRLCVSSPTIKVPGQSIVCIPHKFVVRIIGESQGDNAVDDTAS